MGFAAEVMEWTHKVQRREDVFVQELSRELFTSVIEATPVDTGRAVANWKASIGAPDAPVTEDTDPSRSATLAAMNGVVDEAKAGDRVWLANNLFYIGMIERGTKATPPVGMVATALASAPAMTARALDAAGANE